MAAEPYITFSEDCAYAFVESTPQTAEATAAVRCLDGRMTDEQTPVLPHVIDWSSERARVVGLEIWEEHAGRRLRQPEPGARVLWRIEIDDALTVDEPSGSDDPGGEGLIAMLADLHAQGRVDEHELARARVLHDAVQQAESERQARQAARPADAPRAYLSEEDGALMARMFVQVTTALANAAVPDADVLADAMGPLRERLQAGEERQVQALRAEIGDRERS